MMCSSTNAQLVSCTKYVLMYIVKTNQLQANGVQKQGL